MPDPELLALLTEGVEAWNKWRSQRFYEADVDLSGATLKGFYLSGANFARADLSKAELDGADLGSANLLGASLAGASLCNVNLGNADLIDTDLSRADLFHASLAGTFLRGANLYAADLTEVTLLETVFTNVNLFRATGLDTCRHLGPSTLDFRTLVWSGNLPVPFLRGCGLLDQWIEYLPSLLPAKPIQFHSCFISYATEDQDFADRVHADLQNKGVRCWFAPHDIRGGRKIHEQIDEAIRIYDKLLLILSPASMHSEWVKTELAKARRREVRENRRMLFPLRLVDFETLRDWECFDADSGKDSAREIREYFIPDFSNWKTDRDSYQQAFDRLIRDLRSEKAA